MNLPAFPQSADTVRIWLPEAAEPDTYAEFRGSFSAPADKQITLCISADSAYAVFLNDRLAAFSACGDYPRYKLYDRVDVTEYCTAENDLRIQVWYIGENSQTYLIGEPGVAFEISSDGKLLLQSGKAMRCRKLTAYQKMDRVISPQLGRGFHYDSGAETAQSYGVCSSVPVWENLIPRSTKPLMLGAPVSAAVSALPDGYLFDLGKEVVGFLQLEVDSPCRQKLLISFGERLENENVPRRIGTRDFSVEYTASPGENVYLNPFRRLAGRYLQVTCDNPIRLRACTLRPVFLPVREKTVEITNPLDRAIYRACVNTLKCCMHEHYEDCPWREQAMYLMDSRNQMLSGYYAFENATYARDMLLLMAQGQREDGLFDLCFPAGINYPIPFFSLVYLKILDEYVAHTGDASVLPMVAAQVERLIAAFDARVEENGLIADFPYPFWNFYEWSEKSSNETDITRLSDDPYRKNYSIILNAMYVLAKEQYGRLYGVPTDTSVSRQAIKETFFVPEKGLYKLSTDGEDYSMLGNSMALLLGLGDRAIAKRLCSDKDLIPVTLSMNAFFYDALLQFGDTFRGFIVSDIRGKYKPMLDAGSDTVWETVPGWRDFDGAGSMCHGWSAIPIYYYHLLGLATENSDD